MGGGSSKKKKDKNAPSNLFDREKENEKKQKKKREVNLNKKRKAIHEPHLQLPGGAPTPQPGPSSAPSAPLPLRSYDDEALERMRYQLNHDSEAFLLNNILLSVQFFQNYERDVDLIRKNPVTEREHFINEAMVQLHKHVFFADRLQECVYEHVSYQRQRGQSEPLFTPRMFVVYDNVEPSQPGDMSDYSAVLDAPFYKLLMENCKDELGYVKLKKLEVLESTLAKESDVTKSDELSLGDSTSETESNDSDDSPYTSKGGKLLQSIETKLLNSRTLGQSLETNKIEINNNIVESPGRRFSGPNKQISLQAEKGNISNLNAIQKRNIPLFEENNIREHNKNVKEKKDGPHDIENKTRKSILKPRPKYMKNKIQYINTQKGSSNVAVGTEFYRDSGYMSTSGSRQTDASETESDYGYATITESTTPKKVVLSVQNCSGNSGVLPERCWSSKKIKAVDNWSDDEDEESSGSASKSSASRNLYVTHYYLNSLNFMKNFVDNFIMNIGFGLGLTQDAINNSLTQGASIYCNSTKNGIRSSYEVFPALKLTAWPSAANPWLIRERRIIQNPRTNLTYQWPLKKNVDKTSDLGCLLVPIGFRPTRGLNPNQMLQWRIMFPEAERYLESTLSHSHMRCYLFALTLQKTFMENETSKIGIDASHIKNHLFWECEDNHAKWPEDRLGETLRGFFENLYVHFRQARFPNYFIQDSNDFKNIPRPSLRKAQGSLSYLLETPVMHILGALDKVKYTTKDFYPAFKSYSLYEILTNKNPLRLINPAIPESVTYEEGDSDSDSNAHTNPWDREKSGDKYYQWKKKKQRQMLERRDGISNRTHKAGEKQVRQINTHAIIPKKMEAERRPLVLKFFIKHFIAMARSSEKFEAINQALIYLQQANRLSILLREEAPGDISVKEFLEVIRDLLPDCQRKLAMQAREKSKIVPRRESQLELPARRSIHSHRPRFENIVSQDSPTEFQGTSAFTFVEVHSENQNNVRLHDVSGEESKL